MPQTLPFDQEMEDAIQLENEEENMENELPWYIISHKRTFNKVQDIQIQIMTWTTVIITPLILVFNMMDESLPPEKQANLSERLLWLVWLNDISWCIEIILKFFTSTPTAHTFKEISLDYIKGFFFFDILATLPPMIFL